MLEKLKPALYSTLIIFGFFFIPSFFEEGAVWFSFIVLFYAAAGNFLYGIPVSLISDLLTKKLDKGRFFAAAGIHILLGFATVFVIEGFALIAVICAALFFGLDEWQKSRGQAGKQKRGLVLKGGAVPGFCCPGHYRNECAWGADGRRNQYHLSYSGRLRGLDCGLL